jgi:hypothetical protein
MFTLCLAVVQVAFYPNMSRIGQEKSQSEQGEAGLTGLPRGAGMPTSLARLRRSPAGAEAQ